MTKNEFIDKLNMDLRGEYRHFLFYLYHSSVVRGLHRHEIGELLYEHAQSEMSHISEFSKTIIGLGEKPYCVTDESIYNTADFFPHFEKPEDIIAYALQMEDEVVANYAARMKETSCLQEPDATFVSLFLEEQILDSRKDADEFREMLKI